MSRVNANRCSDGNTHVHRLVVVESSQRSASPSSGSDQESESDGEVSALFALNKRAGFDANQKRIWSSSIDRDNCKPLLCSWCLNL